MLKSAKQWQKPHAWPGTTLANELQAKNFAQVLVLSAAVSMEQQELSKLKESQICCFEVIFTAFVAFSVRNAC